MDVVVTVPKARWALWLSEGDRAGDDPTGQEYYFALGRNMPLIEPGERVYIVSWGRLRGYAPLVRLERALRGYKADFRLIRAGGAVACTIPAHVRGFQGFRYRWWDRAEERLYPTWRTP